MIISHAHRFIFIKTKKTAGTSVEIALSRFCGDGDVITRLPAEDERIRHESGGRAPANFMIPRSRYTPYEWFRYLAEGRRARLVNHSRAHRVRRFVGGRIWESYFTFCFERNPWDKAVSLYYWRTRGMRERPDFSSFLRSGRAHKLSNRKIYAVAGRTAVDRVYRYEEMDDALRDIARRTGLPAVPELPVTKGGTRPRRKPYRDVVGPGDREYIARVCRREIDELGYAF